MRTLRYYDKIDLLRPTAYTASGRRLYTESDFVRLQQILSLKLIGLSLEEIKSLLLDGADDMQALLAQQKRLLTEKVRRLSQVIVTIEHAQAHIQSSGSLDLENLIQIIEVMMMNLQNDWIAQFLNEDQQTSIKLVNQNQTLDEQRQMGQAWQSLFKDIHDNLHTDDQAVITDLITRWDNLISTFAGNNDELVANLTGAYAHLSQIETSESVKLWLRDIQQAVQFIQQARLSEWTVGFDN